MTKLRIALPTSRLLGLTQQLFNSVGYSLRQPEGDKMIFVSNDPDLAISTYRDRGIPDVIRRGGADLGIVGYDWLVEKQTDYLQNGGWRLSGDSNIKELKDLGFGRVDIVVAVPRMYGLDEASQGYQTGPETYQRIMSAVRDRGRGKVIIASQYENVARRSWRLYANGSPYEYRDPGGGQTENFLRGNPPQADMIIDVYETGRTIRNAGGVVVDRLFPSTARLIAHKGALDDRGKLERIQDLLTNLDTNPQVDYTRITMHVPKDRLDALVREIPAMRSPTKAELANGDHYSVQIAVPRNQVVLIRPKLYRLGAIDILEDDIDRVLTKAPSAEHFLKI